MTVGAMCYAPELLARTYFANLIVSNSIHQSKLIYSGSFQGWAYVLHTFLSASHNETNPSKVQPASRDIGNVCFFSHRSKWALFVTQLVCLISDLACTFLSVICGCV